MQFSDGNVMRVARRISFVTETAYLCWPLWETRFCIDDRRDDQSDI